MNEDQYNQSLLSHLFGELISFGAFTCMRICAQAHSDHSVTQEETSSRPQTPVTDSQLHKRDKRPTSLLPLLT